MQAVHALTLIPCIRDMALSGLSALSVLMVLNAWMPPAPNSDAVKLISDTWLSVIPFRFTNTTTTTSDTSFCC